MDGLIDVFVRDLAAEVDESVAADPTEPYHEIHFTKLLLEEFAERNVFEDPVLLSQGGEGRFSKTPYKITGYELSDDEERILLVTTIYTGTRQPARVPRDKVFKAIERAIWFYAASCDGLHSKIEPANTDASDLARQIFEKQSAIRVLRVVVLSDGILSELSKELDVGYKNVRVVAELYGIEQIYRILSKGECRSDIVVDIDQILGENLRCLRVGASTAGYDTYLTAIPAALLASTYERFGTRLLELNVRAFLGVRGRKSVNAGLRRTIVDEPTNFLAYNNGIVATVDDLSLVETEGGNVEISRLMGLQIVNGGQTTASLHRARRQDAADLAGIYVPAKIIRVAADRLGEMVGAISRSANSQNTVQPADFSANDPFHVAVENLAYNTWLSGARGRWFYERARGSYEASEGNAAATKAQLKRFKTETPKQRRFTKTDLAKTLNAWSGRPNLVSFGSQKNFQHFMQQLKVDHPDGFVPDSHWYRSFVAKMIVFRTVQEIVKSEKFPAYQANITAYTTALIADRIGGNLRYDQIWERQAVSDPFKDIIRLWVKLVDDGLRRTAGMKMPTEWAKRSECWQLVKDLELPLLNAAPPELSAH